MGQAAGSFLDKGVPGGMNKFDSGSDACRRVLATADYICQGLGKRGDRRIARREGVDGAAARPRSRIPCREEIAVL